MKFALKSLLLACPLVSVLHAFPSAPHYTLYGMVRDQVGQTVTSEGAKIILLKGGVEVGDTPITTRLIDQNYELNIRIDQSIAGTALYTAKAIPANVLFQPRA